MNKVIRFLYTLLLVTFIFPSGTLFSIPIKTGLCILLLFLILLNRFKVDKISCIFVFVLIMVSLWGLLSIINGYETFLDFFETYISMLLIVWISYEIKKKNIMSINKIFRIITFDVICIILIKIIMELLIITKLVDIEQIKNLYYQVFSTQVMTMYFNLGPLTIYRIMASNDNIPYVWFSFYLIFSNQKFKKLLVFFMITLFTLIVFSRVLMLQFAVVLAVAYILYVINSRKRHAISILVSFAVIVLCALIVLSNSSIVDSIIYRFSGYNTIESDAIRDEQTQYLLSGFFESPFIGHGSGSYVKEYVRSELTKFSYEKEYLSYLFQFGIIGFILIICVTMYSCSSICLSRKMNKHIKYIVILNIVIWAIKPFFNPGFLSSNSGIIISCIYFCSIHYNDLLFDRKKIISHNHIISERGIYENV